MNAHEAATRIKLAWQKAQPGGCKILSAAAGRCAPCTCVLCLADELQARVHLYRDALKSFMEVETDHGYVGRAMAHNGIDYGEVRDLLKEDADPEDPK